MQNSAEEICGRPRTPASVGCILRSSSYILAARAHTCFYTLYHFVLFLLFPELIFGLSLATGHRVTPTSAPLNVTSRLWLRPVLLIAWQLKCEGSKWEDKYKSAQAGRLSQTKARSLPLFSQLSFNFKGKKKDNFTTFIYSNHIQLPQHELHDPGSCSFYENTCTLLLGGAK